jgi:sulfide:quinone oxidoreductase
MSSRSAVAVLIAGGGVAALEAALALRDLAGERVRVDLLAPEPYFWIRPAAVAEPFALGEARHFDLSSLAAAAGASYLPGTLDGVDADRHLAHTSTRGTVPYERLLLACGAVPATAVPGALTFRGPADTGAFARLLDELEGGSVRRLVFAVPWGAVWALPLYELALMTAARLEQLRVGGVEIAFVTPEQRPLELFGEQASRTVRELLDDRGIAVHGRCYPSEAADGELRLVSGPPVPADRVVALPRLHGPRIDGIPQTIDGFVAVDEHGRVEGVDDVFAAGDVTTFAVKQGGIAAQQAEAAAESIAAGVGALDAEPRPFRPMLRGLLLTGHAPRYLRRDLARDDTSWVSETPIWWPPAKLVGRRLPAFLSGFVEGPVAEAGEPPEGAVPVEVELHAEERPRGTTLRLAAEDYRSDAPTAGDVMRERPVVAPEDTLGEVAERMRRLDVGSALVAEYGRLIGIVTGRDLMRAVAARIHPSEARVRQWMTAEPVVVSPDTTVEAALLLMREYGIHRLPVVDGRRPVGMVGLADATRATRDAGHPAVGLGF